MRYFILLCFVLLAGCGDGATVQPPPLTTVTTSAGIKVSSISTLSLGHLAEIDNQYDELLRIAAAPPNNYQVFPAPTEIHIFIVKRDSRCRQIGFIVAQDVPKGTNYDGTEYDMDGKVDGKVEMCVGGRYNHGNGSIEVTADGIVGTDIVRYELEHWLLFRVDRDRYWKTLIHTAENPHPILGDGGMQKALARESMYEIQ